MKRETRDSDVEYKLKRIDRRAARFRVRASELVAKAERLDKEYWRVRLGDPNICRMPRVRVIH